MSDKPLKDSIEMLISLNESFNWEFNWLQTVTYIYVRFDVQNFNASRMRETYNVTRQFLHTRAKRKCIVYCNESGNQIYLIKWFYTWLLYIPIPVWCVRSPNIFVTFWILREKSTLIRVWIQSTWLLLTHPNYILFEERKHEMLPKQTES